MKSLSAKLFAIFTIAVVAVAIWGWVALFNHGAQGTEAQWSGVDETVVEKYASEAGRPASKPLINTDRGDMLLFFFTIAGAAGGFVAGYCWRKLTTEKTTKGKS